MCLWWWLVSTSSALGARLQVLGYCTAAPRLTISCFAAHSPILMDTDHDHWWARIEDLTRLSQVKDLHYTVLCTSVPLSPFLLPPWPKEYSQWSCSLYLQGSGCTRIPLVWGHNFSVQDVHPLFLDMTAAAACVLVQHNGHWFCCVLVWVNVDVLACCIYYKYLFVAFPTWVIRW